MLHGTIAAWWHRAWTHALVKVKTIMRVLHGTLAGSRILVIWAHPGLKAREISRRVLWLIHSIMVGRFAATDCGCLID